MALNSAKISEWCARLYFSEETRTTHQLSTNRKGAVCVRSILKETGWGEVGPNADSARKSPHVRLRLSKPFHTTEHFYGIIYATPSHALAHGTFRAETAGDPPSETEGGSAANTPGGTTARPAAGGRRGTPRAYSPIVNNVMC